MTLVHFMILIQTTAIVAIVGILSYRWSFMDTSFGGWLGFLLPMFCALACFILGACYQSPHIKRPSGNVTKQGDQSLIPETIMILLVLAAALAVVAAMAGVGV